MAITVAAGAPGTVVLDVDGGAIRRETDLLALEASGGESLALGDGIHGMKWVGFTYDPSCSHAFAFGEWSHAERGRHGAVLGQVLDANGVRTGWVWGTWRPSLSLHGDDLFVAKGITETGAYAGTARGHFSDGRFEGTWSGLGSALPVPDLGEARVLPAHGTTHGVYGGGSPATPARGVWLGTGATFCGISMPVPD